MGKKYKIFEKNTRFFESVLFCVLLSAELEKMIASSYGIETGVNISITKSSLPSPIILPGGMIIVPFDWFLQSESYQKFEALLNLALGTFEGRKVFIDFLKEQKLS